MGATRMSASVPLRLRTIAVLVLFLGGIAIAAVGHKPLSIGETFPSIDDALKIEDLDVSQVAYVTLTEQTPEVWLRFDVEAPIDLYFSLGIPVLDRLETYRPTVRLIGPGEEPNDGQAFETSATGEPELFREPFTGTDSWILIEETIPLVESGTYYLVASAPPGEADKLWIAIGRREAFGLRDIFSFPTVIRRVRAFHEIEPSGPTRTEWATLLGLVIIGGIVLLAALNANE
jgi:hypothetical protein